MENNHYTTNYPYIPHHLNMYSILQEIPKNSNKKKNINTANILSLPETDSTELPETDPTKLPETDPTKLPETDLTELPDADLTELPETDLTDLTDVNTDPPDADTMDLPDANTEILADENNYIEVHEKILDISKYRKIHDIQNTKIYKYSKKMDLLFNNIFPKTANGVQIDYTKLLITNIGIYSSSYQEEADILSKIIINIFTKDVNGINLGNPNKINCKKDITITDATGNIGGNSISFATNFKYVNIVEISNIHCYVLKHNMNIYNFKNYKIHNNDYIEISRQINQDVIFLDPPWGGKKYKKKENIKLFLSGISIEDIVNYIYNYSKLIILKAPYNFDFQSFFNKTKVKIYSLYKLHKYMIIIIYTMEPIDTN